MAAKFEIIIDIIKGYLPIILFSGYIENNLALIQILLGIAAVLGHVFPVFYGFKGGKGAGTLVGVVLAIFPYSVPFIFLVWIIILVLTGFVGLSTMSAGVFLVLITYK